MTKQLIGKVFLCFSIAFILLSINKTRAVFGEEITGPLGLAGASLGLDSYYDGEEEGKVPYLITVTDGYSDNIAIVNEEEVSSKLYIRSKVGVRGEDTKLGFLYPNAGLEIVSDEIFTYKYNGVEEQWVKVKSDTIEGYAHSGFLLMGDEAKKKADELKQIYAVVNKINGSLNVRSTPSVSGDIVTKVKYGESLLVSKALVVNKDEADYKLWVEVFVDGDSEDCGSVGYVSLDYVSINYELQWAIKYCRYGENVSDARVAICDEAIKYLGTKYVWGGNDPKKGIDCSGLVKYVFQHVSYTKNMNSVKNMPRVSNDMYQSKLYKHIKKSELKPGDLVFYANSQKVFHVAIYIGNGKIVHSSTNTKGVGISDIDFITPKATYYVRVIND